MPGWFGALFSETKCPFECGGGGCKTHSGNAQCLRHVFEEGFLTTGVNSGVNICPNNGLTIQGLDFGTYFLKFFRSILEPFHQDYCYFHDKNGKTIFGKEKKNFQKQTMTLPSKKNSSKLIFIPKYVDLRTCRKNGAYLCMSHLASFLSLTPPSPQCNLVLFFGHKKNVLRG